VKRSGAFVRVLIDCTEKSALEEQTKRFGFAGIPAVYFLDGDGKVKDKVIGATSAAGFLKKFETLLPAANVAPTAAQDDASKRILDRIQKELDDSGKRMRDDIGKIVKSELEKAGVAKTVQPPKAKPVEEQVKELLPKLSDAGLTGRLKKFLATEKGLEFVKATLQQQGIESVSDAIEQYFEKGDKGKLVLRQEFESQVEQMLPEEPKDPPKDPSKDPPKDPPVAKKPAYLGISPDDFTDDDRKALGLTPPNGIKLFEVKAGSPAEKSGLKTGDVLVQIGKKDVSEQNIGELMKAYKSGDSVDVVVIRGKERKTIKVTFGEKK
jgi:hypothetical protein